jgi:hypothetical protein
MESLKISCALAEGVRFDFPSRFAISALPYIWDDERNHQICFVSSRQWNAATRRDEFGSMIASADLVLPNDRAVAGRVLTQGAEASRSWPVPFVHQMLLDAMHESFEQAELEIPSIEHIPELYRPQKVITTLLSAIEQRNGSVFLLGGAPVTLIKAEKNIRATFPGLAIVGSMHGLYRPQEEAALIEAIQKSTPMLILAGAPLPSGERWIPRHMAATRSGIFLYYGAIFRWFTGS